MNLIQASSCPGGMSDKGRGGHGALWNECVCRCGGCPRKHGHHRRFDYAALMAVTELGSNFNWTDVLHDSNPNPNLVHSRSSRRRWSSIHSSVPQVRKTTTTLLLHLLWYRHHHHQPPLVHWMCTAYRLWLRNRPNAMMQPLNFTRADAME